MHVFHHLSQKHLLPPENGLSIADIGRRIVMESTIELHTKGFKGFSKQLTATTVQLRTVNKELKKTNQLVEELIGLENQLKS